MVFHVTAHFLLKPTLYLMSVCPSLENYLESLMVIIESLPT